MNSMVRLNVLPLIASTYKLNSFRLTFQFPLEKSIQKKIRSLNMLWVQTGLNWAKTAQLKILNTNSTSKRCASSLKMPSTLNLSNSIAKVSAAPARQTPTWSAGDRIASIRHSERRLRTHFWFMALVIRSKSRQTTSLDLRSKGRLIKAVELRIKTW